jgi:hypothetical protein
MRHTRPTFRLAAIVLAGALLLPGCTFIREFITDYKSGKVVAAEHGVLLYADDVLALPGQDVNLRAHLKTPHAFRGIANVTVAFSIDGRPIGSAVTDKQGLAQLWWKAPLKGDHKILIQPTALPPDIDDEDTGALKNHYELFLSVRPSDQKFIVVDLDHTLVNDSGVHVLSKDDSPQMPQSQEALRRLVETYSVIYLTARPDELTRKSKFWLEANKYPAGVLIACDLRQPADSGKFKSQCLSIQRRAFPNILFGVGDLSSDSGAYLANDVTAYLLKPWPSDARRRRELARQIRAMKDKDRVQVVRDWNEVEEGIRTGRRFSADDFAANLEAESR